MTTRHASLPTGFSAIFEMTVTTVLDRAPWEDIGPSIIAPNAGARTFRTQKFATYTYMSNNGLHQPVRGRYASSIEGPPPRCHLPLPLDRGRAGCGARLPRSARRSRAAGADPERRAAFRTGVRKFEPPFELVAREEGSERLRRRARRRQPRRAHARSDAAGARRQAVACVSDAVRGGGGALGRGRPRAGDGGALHARAGQERGRPGDEAVGTGGLDLQAGDGDGARRARRLARHARLLSRRRALGGGVEPAFDSAHRSHVQLVRLRARQVAERDHRAAGARSSEPGRARARGARARL